MTSNLRAWLLVVSVVGLCSFTAGRWGSHLGSAARVVEKKAVQQEVRELLSTLDVVERNIADPVNVADAIYKGSIPAMLQRLDPHSAFYDPRAYEHLREDQRGRYAGVGMAILAWGDDILVDYPFPKSPAFRAGIRPGDAIARIDGEPAAGLSVEEVARRVRGPEGTAVALDLRRHSVEGLISVELVRGNIPRSSVPLAFSLRDNIGYLHISTFNENTPDEFDSELAKLEETGITGLILDLRNNQGGLLSAGIHVADGFLNRGQTIVSHWGRASDRRSYDSRSRPGERNYPVTVLVNCGSASASEVVAGALQDHDRALIVGSNTFGKGLIQAVYNLADTTGLVLTTARYYTPSGRLIQRSYDNISPRKYYSDPCADSYRPPRAEPHVTDLGRRVFSGGGIAPDVRLDERSPDTFQKSMEDRRAFEAYAQQYCLERDALPQGWTPGQGDVQDFQDYLSDQVVPFEDSAFDEDGPYIVRQLKRHIYTACVNVDEGLRADVELDPAVAEAVALLPEARKLLDRVTEALAQRD
jgi:carboxyl-terminal processing protease